MHDEVTRCISFCDAAGADDGFEGRLSKLKGKGGKKQETPREALKKAQDDEKKGSGGQPKYDFTQEEVYLETAPHRGDLALNLALGTTLLWLPLTIASVARGAFVKYRFTNMRVSVTTKAGPLRDEQLDAAYQEVQEIQTVGRAFGVWGDMVITLKGGDKIELRAVPRYKELEEYILKRKDELKGSNLNPKSAAAQPVQAGKGF